MPPDNSTPSSTSSFLPPIPKPIQTLFSHFPLRTLPANALPLHSTTIHVHLNEQPTLHIFTHPSSPPANNSPSPNPSCLRLQTLLHLSGAHFATVSSNNHASPSGALPFLTTPEGIVTAGRIKGYIRRTNAQKVAEVALEANKLYLALLEPVRRAYLTALYLHDGNFNEICAPLYVQSASHSAIVRAALAPSLRQAAYDAVTTVGNDAVATDPWTWLRDCWQGARVDEETIAEEAEEALGALSTLLGERTWFANGKDEGKDAPGEMDASVFAYVHVILWLFAENREDLHEARGKVAARLMSTIRRYENLVTHRRRVLDICYS